MLPFCSKFPYLNEKIKDINKSLLKKRYLLVSDEIIDAINAIDRVNFSEILPIKSLDELYNTVHVKKEIPELIHMNQTTSNLFMQLFIEIEHKYNYKFTNIQHLFELDTIWEYLPIDIKEMVLSMAMSAFSLNSLDIELLITFMDSINLQVNPFILSNKLDSLKKSIDSKK